MTSASLAAYALDEARATGRNVPPFCPFVRFFIQRHPAYVDLVGWTFYLDRELFPETFAADVHPDTAAVMAATQRAGSESMAVSSQGVH